MSEPQKEHVKKMTETDHAKRPASETVNLYLDAFYLGDFDRARSVVANDFSFRGPFVEVRGREPFFASAEGLRGIVRGRRMLRQWVEGDEVSSIYEVLIETPTRAGSVVMSEWHVVRDGELISGRVLFDTAAFRDVVSPN
jgi:ketosteroid isomerase-like protein